MTCSINHSHYIACAHAGTCKCTNGMPSWQTARQTVHAARQACAATRTRAHAHVHITHSVTITLSQHDVSLIAHTNKYSAQMHAMDNDKKMAMPMHGLAGRKRRMFEIGLVMDENMAGRNSLFRSCYYGRESGRHDGSDVVRGGGRRESGRRAEGGRVCDSESEEDMVMANILLSLAKK